MCNGGLLGCYKCSKPNRFQAAKRFAWDRYIALFLNLFAFQSVNSYSRLVPATGIELSMLARIVVKRV